MSDYKLTFKLKQHTPIIHFQHDQYGATLRASELKPKLDKFILLKLGKEVEPTLTDTEAIYQRGISEAKSRNWLVGNGEHTALDYKINLFSENSKCYRLGFPKKNNEGKIEWDEQFPNYFGNMKKEDEKKEPKEFIFSKDFLDGEIVVFDINLKKSISDSLPRFFFFNNFGTRQNKGFGSFSIIEVDGKTAEQVDRHSDYPSFEVNLLNLPKSIEGKYKKLQEEAGLLLTKKNYTEVEEVSNLFIRHNLFYRIELFYKTLRSGINRPNKLYFKSLMFQYAKSLSPSQQWDKRTMREHFYQNYQKYRELLLKPYPNNGTLKFTPSGSHEKDKLLFRDLLGLSSLQQWKFYSDSITKEGVKKINNKIAVQRFKSPITFKPIRIDKDIFRVYIFCNPIPDGYLGEKIKINSDKFSKLNPLTLSLPNQFDVCKYLHDAVTLYILQNNNYTSYDENFKQYVSNSNSEEAKYLLDIFSQLNKFYSQGEGK